MKLFKKKEKLGPLPISLITEDIKEPKEAKKKQAKRRDNLEWIDELEMLDAIFGDDFI